MPATLPLTLRDCQASRLRLTTQCDHCRVGALPDVERLVEAAGKLADRPILELFDAGKLVCARCTKPYAGLTVEWTGPRPLDVARIVRFWRPGSLSDPAIEGYWRGVRETKERMTKGSAA